ncbi:MAG: TetR/AcrR family transcriptional regulator [Candidatus Eisenbacteria bacterium]
MTDSEGSPGASANRTRRRALRTRRRLLQAALSVFSEKGIDAATIEEITERADLGKGTLYRHFSTKDRLVTALAAEAVDRLALGFSIGSPAPSSLEAGLRRIVRAHVAFFRQNRSEFLLLFQSRLFIDASRDGAPEIERPLSRYIDAVEREAASFLPRPVGREKVRRLALAVAGFTSGVLSFASIGMDPGEIEDSLDSFLEAFVAEAVRLLTSEQSHVPAGGAAL